MREIEKMNGGRGRMEVIRKVDEKGDEGGGGRGGGGGW